MTSSTVIAQSRSLPTEGSSPSRVNPPATPKQFALLRKLLAERTGDPAAEALRDELNELLVSGKLDRRNASSAVSALVRIPRCRPQDAPEELSFPDGRYALGDEEGAVKFYAVHDGQVWALASDDELPLSPRASQAVAAAIAADPEGASVRYGLTVGRCGRCGRTLTDPDSIAAGIGPVCATRFRS